MDDVVVDYHLINATFRSMEYRIIQHKQVNVFSKLRLTLKISEASSAVTGHGLIIPQLRSI